MAKRPVKRLTMEDQVTHDQYTSERDAYTDEDAKQLGYPSVEVLRLEDKLSELAGEWRTTKEDRLVLEYQNLLYQMILKGYDVDTLPIQDQLPPDQMPELPPLKVKEAIQKVYQVD